MSKFTKILATLGPSSLKKGIIRKMIAAGTNGFRINTAHGSFEQYSSMIASVRKVGHYPIVIDIKGTELRVQSDKDITLKRSEELFISYTKGPINFSHAFTSDIQEGDTVLYDDGRLRGSIKKITKDGIRIAFTTKVIFRANKTMQIPDRHLQLPSLTARDKKALRFAKEQGAAFIALSYTQSAKDVTRVKKYLKGTDIGIIAKIENQTGVDNAREILQECSGIMVARGDLGIEITQERLPAVQKKLLQLCNEQGKIGILATQVLESMVQNATQTRAETTDIANAVLDGADCLMLSEETAVGNYPVECIRVMSRVAIAIESEVTSKPLPASNLSQSITVAAASLVQTSSVNKVVALTRSGYTALQISRFRLPIPLLAITTLPIVEEQLQLVYGITPVCYPKLPKNGRLPWSANTLHQDKRVSKKDLVLFVAGTHTHKENISNLIEIGKIDELIGYHKS